MTVCPRGPGCRQTGEVEIRLDGGNAGGAVRAGDTVRRAAGPWTPSVHALLAHLAGRGFAGSPRPLGVDEQGREVLTFLAGESVGSARHQPARPGGTRPAIRPDREGGRSRRPRGRLGRTRAFHITPTAEPSFAPPRARPGLQWPHPAQALLATVGRWGAQAIPDRPQSGSSGVGGAPDPPGGAVPPLRQGERIPGG
jgi:hypothetical protein